MKYLLIVDDYMPDSIKVAAKMMHELAIDLIVKGHDVTVLTPKYNIVGRYEIQILDGVTICYFKSGKLKNASRIKRAINESLLSFNAIINARRFLLANEKDAIIYYSPSIFWGLLVKYLKRKWKSKSYLILRDLFPQWAIDNGTLKTGSYITKYFRFFERQNYVAADRIVVESQNNMSYFDNYYKEFTYKVDLLYNWSAIEEENIVNSHYRKKLGLENKIIFFYGGNIGKGQDIPNLIRLAIRMRKYENAHFLFVGEGHAVEELNTLIVQNKLINVTYHPSVSQSEFSKLLSEIDVGLCSLDKEFKTVFFPGKLLGYMKFRIPILGSINKGNDIKEIVESHKAGFVSYNGDDDELFNNAIMLFDDNKLRSNMGNNAYSLLLAKFSVDNASSRILDFLN